MSVLRNLESKIADLVEGTFGRVFRSEVRPVELARGLAKEMDEHKTVSVSRVYVPNEYVVWLSPEDADASRASRTRSSTSSAPTCSSTRAARSSRSSRARRSSSAPTTACPSASSASRRGSCARPTSRAAGERRAEQGDHGHTMVYSTSDRLRAREEHRTRPPPGRRGR